jgi:murein endopeptidase
VRLRWSVLVGLGIAGCTVGLRPERPSAVRQANATAVDPPAAPSTPPERSNGAAETPAADQAATEGPEDEAEIDDGIESPEAPGGRTVKHPLDGWTRKQIDEALKKDPASLGSMSVGATNAGTLINGVQMPPGDRWILVDPGHAWGTQETIDDLIRCIDKVNEQFPGTPKLPIGHISAKRGGHLSPHVSHQAGRDADVGYYYTDAERWYAPARADNLDRARTWALVRAFVTETDVDLILIDRSVQRLLKDYAISIGEDREWLDRLFERTGGERPLILHAKGHGTHIHVRFYSPIAQETARRAYDLLLAHHLVEPPSYYVRHRAKRGETLGGIARKYGTTARVIRQANGMRSSLIRANHEYKIPRHGHARPPSGPVRIPDRRLPPHPPTPPAPSPDDNAGVSPVT